MTRRAQSLIGLLVVLVCIVVLAVVGLNALNKSVTGQGSAKEGTVRSMEDKLALSALFQSLSVEAMGNDERYPVPSALTSHGDRADDTTASLFSLMVAKHLVRPPQLISGNEYNPAVVVDPDYDYSSYQPRQDQYWDPDFKADLERESNVSFAHVPLYGQRYDDYWRATLDSTFPVLGNRGPRNGEPDPQSWTYGRDGTWAGHVVFGDGHVEFLTSFTPGRVSYLSDRQQHADNIFAMEDGPGGQDAVIAFTKSMSADGPVLQYD